jgi:hypothetical protein
VAVKVNARMVFGCYLAGGVFVFLCICFMPVCPTLPSKVRVDHFEYDSFEETKILAVAKMAV